MSIKYKDRNKVSIQIYVTREQRQLVKYLATKQNRTVANYAYTILVQHFDSLDNIGRRFRRDIDFICIQCPRDQNRSQRCDSRYNFYLVI